MKSSSEESAARTGIRRADLLEKDHYLQRLLEEISSNTSMKERLAFKGGTCLVKGYLGYYRFSEDVDFTWIDRCVQEVKTRGRTIRECEREVDWLLEEFSGIARSIGLEFEGDKRRRDEVHISSGGRMVTIFFRYRSRIIGAPALLKLEINFVERLLFPLRKRRLIALERGQPDGNRASSFPGLCGQHQTDVELECYDPREILVEKCRAVMTRKSLKMKDLVDIFFIERDLDCSIKDHERQIIEKTAFMTALYRRYKERLETNQLPTAVRAGEEMFRILLVPPPQEMNSAISGVLISLERIRRELAEGRATEG